MANISICVCSMQSYVKITFYSDVTRTSEMKYNDMANASWKSRGAKAR
jgi:hypothetical protein